MKLPLLAILLAAMFGGCALTPPAPPAPASGVPTVQPALIVRPTATAPAGVTTAIGKAAPILTGVNDVLNAGDISTAVDVGVQHAMSADPNHSTQIYLGGLAALTVLSALSKILDHRKVQTAIQTPGTTIAPEAKG